MEGDKDDGFGFDAGFVFEDSDNEKEAPAQAAWAFPDSKRDAQRELEAAGVTSVDAKIQKARAKAKGGASKKGKDKKVEESDDEYSDSDDRLLPG